MLGSARSADRKHLRIDVDNGRTGTAAARRQHAQGDIAGAARDIEEGKRLLVARRIDGRDQRLFPGAVHTARHKIVHEVVAGSDAAEHAIDVRLLVGKRNLEETKIGCFVRPRHGCVSFAGP